mmetsp:Transcript_5172/g.15183  ORF Transcript_5172/g.15183 Transcript_5172/m.15183 type:complete len:893 (-) Transcript_5172:346-3024(-)
MGAVCGCGKKDNVDDFVDETGPLPEQYAKPARPKPALQKALEKYELADGHEPGSQHRPHGCTDTFCCILFLGALAVLAMILVYAHENGDPRKLHHGIDYHGNICGVDPDVANMPYLYWCEDPVYEINETVTFVEDGGATEPAANADPRRNVSSGGGADLDAGPAAPKNLTQDASAALGGEAAMEARSLALPVAGSGVPVLGDGRRLVGLASKASAEEDALGSVPGKPPAGLEAAEPPGASEVTVATTSASPNSRHRRSVRNWFASASNFTRNSKHRKTAEEWFARAGGFSLNLRHPMCMESCPQSNMTAHYCFDRRSTVIENASDGSGTFTEKTTFHFRLVDDYPSMKVAHYCLPTDTRLRRSLGGTLDSSQEALMYHYVQIQHAWPAVLASVGFAVVLGFLYLFLLGLCPGTLIFSTLVLAVVLPLAAGSLALWGWQMEDQHHEFLDQHQELKMLQLPATGDGVEDLAVSIGLIVVGLTVLLTACCLRASLKLAIGSVDAACECLLGVPSLLFEPFINAIFQLSALVCLVYGMGLLLSSGDLSPVHHFNLTYMRGVSRSFVYHDMEHGYIVLYVLIAAWVFEFSMAMEKFVLAYVTQLWYFTDYRTGRKSIPPCALLRGMCVGATCHTGTMALGALCIPPFRVAHWLHSRFCRRRGELGDDEEEGNEVSECVLSCCTCCWACWEGFIKFMQSDSYIVVAIDSYPFFPAAQKAYNVNLYQIEHLGDPNNFLWIFQLWGVFGIASLAAFFTWLLVTSMDIFTQETSPHFVENPEPIAVTGGVAGFVVATIFMHVLRNIADALVFCYALDREWREDQGLPMRGNVPPGLESYLQSAGFGSKRRPSTPTGSYRAAPGPVWSSRNSQSGSGRHTPPTGSRRFSGPHAGSRRSLMRA